MPCAYYMSPEAVARTLHSAFTPLAPCPDKAFDLEAQILAQFPNASPRLVARLIDNLRESAEDLMCHLAEGDAESFRGIVC